MRAMRNATLSAALFVAAGCGSDASTGDAMSTDTSSDLATSTAASSGENSQAGTNSNAGAESDTSSPNEPDGDGPIDLTSEPVCFDSRIPFAERDNPSFEFDLDDVLAFVEGQHEALLTWSGSASTTVAATVSSIEAFYVASQDNPRSEIVRVDGCQDYLQLDATVSFMTADERINHEWATLTFDVYTGERAVAFDGVDAEDIGANYTSEDASNCVSSVQFDMTLAPTGFSGNLRDTVLVPCDSGEPVVAVMSRLAGVWEPL